MIETLLIILLFLLVAYAVIQFVGTAIGYLVVAIILIGGTIQNALKSVSWRNQK